MNFVVVENKRNKRERRTMGKCPNVDTFVNRLDKPDWLLWIVTLRAASNMEGGGQKLSCFKNLLS